MTRAIELRDRFDASFAAAAPPPEPPHSDFLCIRGAGEPAAISLGDIASLHADLRVATLPTRAPELLGVAAIRAAVVPIYDLRAALGVAGTGTSVLRWIVVLRGVTAGFAFAVFDGFARIPDRSIVAATLRRHVRGQFVLDERPRSVIDLGSVLAAIETRWRHLGPAKET